MKTDQASEPEPRRPTTLDDMVCELAAALRDTIDETDSAHIDQDPEEAFVDLACRLILRLRGKLTVVPSLTSDAGAAARIFRIFTGWMRAHPRCSYDTRISASGKFQIVVKTPTGTHLFFGETVQDAYAQAAQAVLFSEGTL